MNEMIPIGRETAEILAGNVQSLGEYVSRMAVMLKAMNERVQILESERCVTVRHADVKGLQHMIREKADATARKSYIREAKSITRIRGDIKKMILKSYGITDLHDLPANALDGARRRIENYANIRLIMDLKERENGSG